MVSRPRTLGVAFVAVLVALSGGPALAGATAPAANDDAGDMSDTSATLQNVQVGTLELENVTIRNATIEELSIQQLEMVANQEIQQQVTETANESPTDRTGENASDEIVISGVSFESLVMQDVSLDQLGNTTGNATNATADNATNMTADGTANATADNATNASTGLEGIIEPDANSVMVENVTIESMNADQLTIREFSVQETGNGGVLQGISDFVGGLFGGDDDGGDGQEGNATAQTEADQTIESLTVEQFNVSEITVDSMTIQTLERQDGGNQTAGNTTNATADNETNMTAADTATADNETNMTADGMTNATATGETISSITAESMTIGNASADAVTFAESQGLQAALEQQAGADGNETDTGENETS